jgi:hypothetical protein
MTSDGSPYHRFKRALATGNLNLVRAAAAELPWIGLDDALQICLLLCDEPDERYERAAVRWLGRFALEARNVTIDAIHAAAAAFDALPMQPETSMETLARLCTQPPRHLTTAHQRGPGCGRAEGAGRRDRGRGRGNRTVREFAFAGNPAERLCARQGPRLRSEAHSAASAARRIDHLVPSGRAFGATTLECPAPHDENPARPP